MTKYPVHIMSTGETMYFDRRSRTPQLWHEFMCSGYDNWERWEHDGYPDEPSLEIIREIRRRERIAQIDLDNFFTELDVMMRDILAAPIDWDAVRAEYEAQQNKGKAQECCEQVLQNSTKSEIGQADKAANPSTQTWIE